MTDPLGPLYEAREVTPAPGVIATVVRRRAAANTRGALLYVHGYVDYFFQDHLAEVVTGLGYDFYAVDLRRCGRSMRPGDLPFFFADLAELEEDVDAAVAVVRADGHDRVAVLGHSTGGLVASLWVAHRRPADVVALVLNSPWLDLAGSAVLRVVGTPVIARLASVRPTVVLPQAISPAYGESVHVDAHGEWSFDTVWKPLVGAPAYAGVVAAVRRGHAQVHRGLGIDVPVLVMHAGRSLLGLKRWEPRAQEADCVLDVQQMRRWAPALGADVETVAIDGGMHDLFLSARPVRDHALAVMGDWLTST